MHQRKLSLKSYKNADCLGSQYHDFRIVNTYPDSITERCFKCHKQVYFRNNVPNHIYLSYHLRSIIQPNNPRYLKEYATTTN